MDQNTTPQDRDREFRVQGEAMKLLQLATGQTQICITPAHDQDPICFEASGGADIDALVDQLRSHGLTVEETLEMVPFADIPVEVPGFDDSPGEPAPLFDTPIEDPFAQPQVS